MRTELWLDCWFYCFCFFSSQFLQQFAACTTTNTYRINGTEQRIQSYTKAVGRMKQNSAHTFLEKAYRYQYVLSCDEGEKINIGRRGTGNRNI